MAPRKPFLLRMAPEIHGALQKWADDELRSLNGQIEFLLQKALLEVGRYPRFGKGKKRRDGGDKAP